MGASIVASSFYCVSESIVKKSLFIPGYSGNLWGSVYEGMEDKEEVEPDGPDGPDGPEGPEGPEGEDGPDGPDGKEKEPIQEGARGCKGAACDKIRPKSLNDEEEIDHAYVDKGATIENSYSQLSNLLGEDSMKKLSAETAKLVKQQQELIGTLKGAGPVIENMKSMMDGLNNTDMQSMQENVSGLISKINEKKK